MKFLLLFLFLFLFSSFTFSQNENQINFSSLEEIATYSPESIIYPKQGLFSNLKQIEINFLTALAYQNASKFLKTDSIISASFKNFDFQNDSLLYIKFRLLHVNQLKLTNNYEKALSNFHEILNYHNSINDTISLINTYVSMAEMYRAIKNLFLGFDYLEKADYLINNCSQSIPKKIIARFYSRKSALYTQTEINKDSVKKYSNKALEIAQEIGDKNLEAESYNELGYLYINLNPHNPKQIAERYFLKAIAIWDSLNYEIYSINCRLNLSRYYNRKHQFEKGLNVLLPKINFIENSNWHWEKGGYFEMLGRLYGGKEDYKNAYFYTDKAKEILLKVNENQYNERLSLLSMQLDIKIKDQVIESNEKKLQFSKSELQLAKDEKFIYIIFLIAAALIAIIFFYSMTRLSRHRNLLTKQKAIISRKNKELKGVSSQKDALLKEINHRVKNNLTILSSLLYLQEKDIVNPEAKSALKNSQFRIHTISLIHESLYQRDDMESVNFQEFLTKLGQFIKSVFIINDKDVKIIIECDDLKCDLTQSVTLGLILNEYITNSFKHAFKEVKSPQIKITFKDKILIYEDNNPEVTKIIKSKGLGLQLVDIFLNQLNAKLLPNKDSNQIKIDLNGIQ